MDLVSKYDSPSSPVQLSVGYVIIEKEQTEKKPTDIPGKWYNQLTYPVFLIQRDNESRTDTLATNNDESGSFHEMCPTWEQEICFGLCVKAGESVLSSSSCPSPPYSTSWSPIFWGLNSCPLAALIFYLLFHSLPAIQYLFISPPLSPLLLVCCWYLLHVSHWTLSWQPLPPVTKIKWDEKEHGLIFVP